METTGKSGVERTGCVPADTVFFREGKPFHRPWTRDPADARGLLLTERDLLDRLGFADLFIREVPNRFNRFHLAA